MSASELGRNKLAEIVKLKGDIGKFMGDMERYQCAITLEGDQGAGKTRKAFILANALAEAGLSVGIFTLETGKDSNVIISLRDEYISRKARANIDFSDECDFAILDKSCKVYDAIIIDSWNKAKTCQEDFERVRKANPRCIIVAIFQRTTGGQIRGGNMPKFDASINIEVCKSSDYKSNYAECTKNRYTHTGQRFGIYTKKLLTDGQD